MASECQYIKKNRINDDVSLLTHLYQNVIITLGKDWKQAASLKFDNCLARESIKVYEAIIIPSINLPIPIEVTEVRFKSNLSKIHPCDASSLLAQGGLFSTIANLATTYI